jgi:hypothetical protein
MQRKKLSNDEIGVLFFLAALIFGGWFRIHPALMAGFPISDGGLFYKMIEALQENGFRLPAYVEYNRISIPFAYPPLAFYFAGLIGKWFHVSTLNILLWMPAITLILILPCVFLLAKHLLKSTLKAGVAAFFYALLPRTLTWLIMGGGITRALGQLFLILAVLNIYLLFTQKQTKFLVGSTIFSAAICMTHPEASIHAIAMGIMLWLSYGRDRDGIKNALLLGLSTLLVTSPWWGTILLRFGIEPFLAASRTGMHSPYSAFVVFANTGDEPFTTIIGALAVIGIFTQFAKRQYLLPAMYILPFFVEPRSAGNVAVIPMALLAAIGLMDVVLPNIMRFEAETSEPKPAGPVLQTRVEKLFLAYLVFALILGMVSFDMEQIGTHLSKESREAFQWVKSNTPQNVEFLVITGKMEIFTDYENEWFPLYADRHSQTTIQGYEWIAGTDFIRRGQIATGFQKCLTSETPQECIHSLAKRAQVRFDYILIQRDGQFADKLTLDLSLSKAYQSVYKSKTVYIFKRQE